MSKVLGEDLSCTMQIDHADRLANNLRYCVYKSFGHYAESLMDYRDALAAHTLGTSQAVMNALTHGPAE